MSWYKYIETAVCVVRRHPFEVGALGTAVVCIAVAGIFLIQMMSDTTISGEVGSGEDQTIVDPALSSVSDSESETTPAAENLPAYVEISGAVIEPGLYEIADGTRIGQVIDEAGGLSQDADQAFIARNINRAKPVVDGEKIHLPSLSETSTGVIREPDRYLTYLTEADTIAPNTQDVTTDLTSDNLRAGDAPSEAGLISINAASAEELESLPGIGEKTAEKIISSRPYDALTDLTDRDIVFDATYEKISDQISL